MYKTIARAAVILPFLLPIAPDTTYGWHGKTHELLAQKSYEFLPNHKERDFFEAHEKDLFAGTRDADKDWGNLQHHIYFHRNGRIRDDIAAICAQNEADDAIKQMREAMIRGATEEDMKSFTYACGRIIHYVVDEHAFHVIDDEDQWVHADFERQVDQTIKTEGSRLYSSVFRVRRDNKVREGITPKNGVEEVARASFFGRASILPAYTLEDKFSQWPETIAGNMALEKSVSGSLSLSANVGSEVLHYIFERAMGPLDSDLSKTDPQQSKEGGNGSG